MHLVKYFWLVVQVHDKNATLSFTNNHFRPILKAKEKLCWWLWNEVTRIKNWAKSKLVLNISVYAIDNLNIDFLAIVGELMTESRLMQKLRHRNIVRLYGVAAEKQPVMIVMGLFVFVADNL